MCVCVCVCVCVEHESLLFENHVERERWWAKEGTTTCPSKGRSLSKGGDDGLVVDSGGSPAVGAHFRKLAGSWLHISFPIILTVKAPPEGKSLEFVSRICGRLGLGERAHFSLVTRENGSSLAVKSRFLHSNQRVCSFSRPFSLRL